MTQEIRKMIEAEWNNIRSLVIDAGKEYQRNETEKNRGIVMDFMKRIAREFCDILYPNNDAMWMKVYYEATEDLGYFFVWGYEH